MSISRPGDLPAPTASATLIGVAEAVTSSPSAFELDLVRGAPAGLVAGGLALGIGFTGTLADGPVTHWVVAGMLSAVLSAACAVFAVRSFRSGREWIGWGLVLAASVGLGGVRAVIARRPLPADHVAVICADGKKVRVEGVIADEPRLDPVRRTISFPLAVSRARREGRKERASTGLVRVSLHGPMPDVAFGDRVRVSGGVFVTPPPSNPGQSDRRAALIRRGLHLELSSWDDVDVLVLAHDQGPWLRSRLLALRRAAVARLSLLVGPPESGLLASIVFGIRSGFEPGVYEAFRATGLVHILVASGMNVGLLAWICLALLGAFRVPARLAAAVTLPVLVVYLLLCGADPPLLRATVMFGLLVAARLLGRPPATVNALAASGAALLLAEPSALFDPSFRFSFAATAGVLAAVPALVARRGPLPRWLVETAGCTLAAQLALFPLLAASFGSVPATGLVANLLVAPLCGVLLAGGLILLGLGVAPWIGPPAGLALKAVLAGLLDLVRICAELPLATVVAPALSPVALAAYLVWALGGLLWLAAAARRSTARWPARVCTAGLAVLVACAGRAALRPAPGDLAITFLDVGQGLGVVIRLPSGRVLLWDAGPGFAGSTVVAPYLAGQGTGRLAGALLTHPHADHAGGMDDVLARVPADWAALSGDSFGAAGLEFRALRDRLLRFGPPVRLVRDGARIEGEPGVRLEIWHPPRRGFTPRKDEAIDERSLVLAIRWRDATALLAGDIRTKAEARLLPRARRLAPVGLLQASHHGSDRANTRAFLEAARPGAAVASAGARSRFGHPHPATVIRYRDRGVTLRVTGREGALTAVTRGEVWTVAPAR